jgi:hypothetical protein
VSLPELLTELDRLIEAAPVHERPGLVVALAARLAQLGAGLVLARPAPGPESPDVNVPAKEAARRLGVSVDWLYRQQKLPFRVKVGRRVVFSAKGLERWSLARAGKV